MPGIGPITASAIVATIGDAANFASARHFAAWIGLVPKQNSSGGRPRQGSISKAGGRTLRRLLVLGATAVIRHTGTKAREGWLAELIGRRSTMVATVAQANKTVWIVWALLARGGSHRPPRRGPRSCRPVTDPRRRSPRPAGA